jgi:SAM-dependent methyltransferase
VTVTCCENRNKFLEFSRIDCLFVKIREIRCQAFISEWWASPMTTVQKKGSNKEMQVLVRKVDPAINALEGEQPFDAVAKEYDAHFTQRRLGRWLRQATHRHLSDLADAHRVLELGCGTGEDALWLARSGAHVVATDASVEMLAVASRKVAGEVDGAGSPLRDRITFTQFNLSEIGRANFEGLGSSTPIPNSHFDAVLANFGVLNCLPDRRPLASLLARWVRPGGRVALVVMSPICPWEIAWYMAHGQIRTAFRRFRGVEARLGQGRVRVWYPSPRRLAAEFAPAFRPIRAAGVGVLLPPSYLSHLVERWPRFFSRLASWEQHLAEHFPWTWLADHYLMVFERR